MRNKKNVPEIRFKGFTEEWLETELSTVAMFNPKAELPNSFEYVDLESVVGTEMISHREENRSTAPSRAQRLAQKGDLFYQTVRPYQKNNYLFKKDADNYVFSTGYAQLRPNGDGEFLLSLIQGELFVKQVLNNCTGTSYPAISSTDLAKIKVPTPDPKEQQAIGNYFLNIDRLINTSQTKLEKLKNIKKACLEKMFPRHGSTTPKLRFKGFTGEWKEKRLEEIAPLRGGFAFQSSVYQNNGIPIIRISNILSNGNIGGEFVYYHEIPNDEGLLLKKGDVLLAMSGATTGKVSVINDSDSKKFYQNQRVGFFSKTSETDYQFISTLVRSELFIRQLRDVLVAGAQPNVSSKDIDKFEFHISKNKTEQEKIGNYFKALDDLIAKTEQQINKLKNIKKACLDKMFVNTEDKI